MSTLVALPDLPDALTRATQLLAQGQPMQAESLLRSVLAVAPQGPAIKGPALAGLQALLGRALALQGRHAEAVPPLQQALRARPGDADTHTELAQCLRALGRGREATEHFERAVKAEPQAHHRRLLLLLHQGTMLDEAGRTTEAMATFRQATQQFPDSADAWAVLGTVQSHLSEPAEARASLGKALQLDPGRIEVMERFARILLDLREYGDAALVFEQILRLQPARPLVASLLLHCKYLTGDWFNLERLQDKVLDLLRSGVSAAEPFGMQGWCADPALLHRSAVEQAARAHPARPGLLAKPRVGKGPKIRLAYLAGEFREQATSILLTEVLERHDRQHFEVLAFDTGWDDGSARRRRIEAACDVRSIRGISDADAARRIRDARVDVLVNLNGYFGLARTGIFSMRPAAVQVNYLGFPGTIGAPYIDYIVADATVIPEDEFAHYTEQVVHLPHCYQPNDSTRAIADRPANRSEAGLPETGFVFCCLNNAYKIVPAVFDVWMRLLQQVSSSVLLLYGDQPELQHNLCHEAQQRGVDPRRLQFAAPWPHSHHLRRLQWCDLFLDTWPYNAHTTGSDALWAGLPVLTCSGRSFPSRVGASLLQAVGLPELITDNLAQYEALALQLATQPDRLAALRSRLRHNLPTAPLYDTRQYTRNLEAAYQHMVQRARDGLPPAPFGVPAKPAAPTA